MFRVSVGMERLTHGLVRLRAVDALDVDRALVDVLALEHLLGEQRVSEGGRHSIDGVQGVSHSTVAGETLTICFQYSRRSEPSASQSSSTISS